MGSSCRAVLICLGPFADDVENLAQRFWFRLKLELLECSYYFKSLWPLCNPAFSATPNLSDWKPRARQPTPARSRDCEGSFENHLGRTGMKAEML
jgi:hypothetical protein